MPDEEKEIDTLKFDAESIDLLREKWSESLANKSKNTQEDRQTDQMLVEKRRDIVLLETQINDKKNVIDYQSAH